jgi:predicted 3-demethylubiquinone-9 3-methyltransferase (glyoxalase superfamily)
MQKITAHLWFDKEAKEAAQLYTSVFERSKIKRTTQLQSTPSGSVDVVVVELAGQEFTLLSAGPPFKFTPAISFLVACTTPDEVESLWQKLIPGGSALMELGSYPFSERYGWLQDRFGLSWQIMLVKDRRITQKITPMLMFVGKVAGKAEDAIRFYVSVFGNAAIGETLRYEVGEGPDARGTIKFAAFTLENVEFAAMDSAHDHKFTFNEAISLMVHCDTQAEIDDYWKKLSAVPSSEQCGWLKDKFGVSWQIVPRVMDEIMATKDKARLARVTEAFLKMKKLDIAALERAYA